MSPCPGASVIQIMSAFESQFATFGVPELGRQFGEASVYLGATNITLPKTMIGDEQIAKINRDDGMWEVRTRLVDIPESLVALPSTSHKLRLPTGTASANEDWNIMNLVGLQDGMHTVRVTRERLVEKSAPDHRRTYP